MNDWRTRLRDADAGRQHDTPADDVRRVRNAVLAATHQSPPRTVPAWRRPLVIAAALLVMVGASAATVTQLTRGKSVIQRSDDRTNPGAVPASGAGEVPTTPMDRQQLQFATPGGTRIIWVFDSNFEVKGTLP
jgi:hypothetical protein